MDVMDLLNVLEVKNRRSVHIYVEHTIDKAVMIDQVYLLSPSGPPPDGPIVDENVGDGETFLISMVMWGMGMTFPMERVMLDMRQPYLVIRKTRLIGMRAKCC
ncbi:hypothetical protein SLA2020_268380 [Shorea laevis]